MQGLRSLCPPLPHWKRLHKRWARDCRLSSRPLIEGQDMSCFALCVTWYAAYRYFQYYYTVSWSLFLAFYSCSVLRGVWIMLALHQKTEHLSRRPSCNNQWIPEIHLGSALRHCEFIQGSHDSFDWLHLPCTKSDTTLSAPWDSVPSATPLMQEPTECCNHPPNSAPEMDVNGHEHLISCRNLALIKLLRTSDWAEAIGTLCWTSNPQDRNTSWRSSPDPWPS